jgi:hypothetical protein
VDSCNFFSSAYQWLLFCFSQGSSDRVLVSIVTRGKRLCGVRPLTLNFRSVSFVRAAAVCCTLRLARLLRFPKQRLGFSGYVYIPATFSLAAMLFGATLVERGILTDLQFGAGFGGLIIVTLVSTVIVQEVHIPVVSTQRLILPCPAAEPGSILALAADALDTSALAQWVLTALQVSTATK